MSVVSLISLVVRHFWSGNWRLLRFLFQNRFKVYFVGIDQHSPRAPYSGTSSMSMQAIVWHSCFSVDQQVV
uniref:Putative ovule protein n=1 Tax=Solanum chacoense TaxID=4108 RepID=A0A0V0GPI4_SOLCH